MPHVLLMLPLVLVVAVEEPPVFTGDAVLLADEGHAVISWSFPEGAGTAAAAFELEQSPDPLFEDTRLRYRGPATAFFVSGLAEGRTFFRVRALRGETPGAWSEPRTVEVAYPSRGRVVVLLTLGCAVFLATVGTILSGWAGRRRGQP